MNDQKDGLQLSSVNHEAIESGVRIILAIAQCIVGTIRQSILVRTSPSILPGSGNGDGEVLHPRANLIVRRIVRAIGQGAGSIQAIDPAPEIVFGLDLVRTIRLALIQPEVRLAVEISRHHAEGVLVFDFGMAMKKFSDLEP